MRRCLVNSRTQITTQALHTDTPPAKLGYKQELRRNFTMVCSLEYKLYCDTKYRRYEPISRHKLTYTLLEQIEVFGIAFSMYVY
jgi:hypothetical protein